MRDEHRDPRAVLRGVEDLLGDEERGIETHLRGLVERRFARREVVPVDRGGRRVVRQHVVQLRVLLLAAESADRADGGQFDIAHLLPVEVILRHLVLRILQILREEVAAGRAHALEQVFRAFGNHGLRLRRIVQVDAPQRVVRGVAVGHVVEPAVLDGHRPVVGVEARQQRAELRLRSLPVEDFRARRAVRRVDEQPFAVLRRPGPEVPQRMLAVLVDEPVGRLRRADAVVIDLLVLVLRRIDALLRCVVGAVIESLRVGRPLRPRVLHPLDPVLRERPVGGVHHADLHPVRSRRRGGIGEIAAVLRERGGGHGHRAVLRQAVGIEEHLARPARLPRAVEHRLVLQPVVIIVVPPVAVLRRRPLPGVVPQLGEPLTDGVAEGNLRQVVVRHGVFGLDPGGRGLREVVLEPAVGIGDLRAEVVVHDPAALGLGIGQEFDPLHIVTTCK